ncbi:hypothetical protein FWG86_01360, partial [Candidatus Saccharibacteria bacterium]|nr:hypothetical protein [Candidatus Saccharibacteria bacterium]
MSHNLKPGGGVFSQARLRYLPKFLISLVLVAILVFALSPLTTYSIDTDTASANIHATVSESITITAINNQAIDLTLTGTDISTGGYSTGTHTVQVSTNSIYGYTLSIQADQANLLRADTPGLYDGTGDSTGGFAPIGGSITSQADSNLTYNLAQLDGLTFASRIVDNTLPDTAAWGFNLDHGTEFTSVPTVPTIISAANNPEDTMSTTITFGAQAGLTTPAGDYGAFITYLATTVDVAPTPLPTPAPIGADMQRITLNGTPGNYSCPTERTRVVDARDNST